MHTISILRALYDNYIYIIKQDPDIAVIDPSSERPVLQYLTDNNLNLSTILLTHHHFDHTGGTAKLKQETGCKIIGPADARLHDVDIRVHEGDSKNILSLAVKVISTPGHTKTHVTYYIPDLKALFTGDTLFISGCGRLFEGSAREMWNSLQKLISLGDDTQVYCGHEYTEYNLRFATTVDPENKSIKEKLTSVRIALATGGYSVPSTIAEEKKYNAFLRAGEPSIKKHLHMESASDVAVFAELRRRKDYF